MLDLPGHPDLHMGAGQRGLAEILVVIPKEVNDRVEEHQQRSVCGAVNRLEFLTEKECSSAQDVDEAGPLEQEAAEVVCEQAGTLERAEFSHEKTEELCELVEEDHQQEQERQLEETGALEQQREQDEAAALREQVTVFEDHVRQLIARINWLQENVQLEEESRLDAERQAESLRLACTEQAGKVEELSEQIAMLFQDLDEQHKHWCSLEAKLDFEHQGRLHIEATLKALAAGAVNGLLRFPVSSQSTMASPSPQSPQSPSNNSVHFTLNDWDAHPSSTTGQDVEIDEAAKRQRDARTDSLFKELNSEWSNYKSEGKLGSWSLAKVLRRLSFSDAKKKRAPSTAAKSEVTEGTRRVYDTAKLTEEIYNLNSEASDVRQQHLADLRKRLELQQQSQAVKSNSPEAWSDMQIRAAANMSHSVSRLSNKRTVGSFRTGLEIDNKTQFKMENLGRQVFHLKKLCTEKTQLVKQEKRRRNEMENRYYMLEKQVLQLRRINLRKADEIKQERTRRQEVEKKSLVEMESLERQVVRLSKLAEAKAHDLKHEQKLRIEAQKRLRDLVNQLKTTSKLPQQVKTERSSKMKQASVKSPPTQQVSGEEVMTKDDGVLVELESLLFKKLGTVESSTSNMERHLWKLQSKQKDRFVLTQLQNPSKADCMAVDQSTSVQLPEKKQEQEEVQQPKTPQFETVHDVIPSYETFGCETVNRTSSENENEAVDTRNDDTNTVSSATTSHSGKDEVSELPWEFGKSVTANEDIISASLPGSLTRKMFQLKETTSRLLKDLEGTQQELMSTPSMMESPVTPSDSGMSTEVQGKGSGWQDACVNGLGSDVNLKQQLRCAFRDWRLDTSRQVEQLEIDTRSELSPTRGWKRQLELLEKLVCGLGGLVVDRTQKIQEQLCTNRDTFEARVEVLEQDLREVKKVLVENGGDVVKEQSNVRRYDTRIGLRVVLSHAVERSPSPQRCDFF